MAFTTHGCATSKGKHRPNRKSWAYDFNSRLKVFKQVQDYLLDVKAVWLLLLDWAVDLKVTHPSQKKQKQKLSVNQLA